ncbi:MAG: cupin domain-containing protein [Gemmatimonadaceae bacterium]
MREHAGTFSVRLGLLLLTSCRSSAPPPLPNVTGDRASSTPLVLDAASGERRVRRTTGLSAVSLTAPFIIKVDRRNGGAPDFMMGTEDIPSGQGIPAHRHRKADEIIFIHRGSGVVELGNQTRNVREGATIYIPKDVRITLRNTGTEPLSIAFVFSKPGFEDYLRETSVPEGQPVPPMTDAERAAIRARHQSHTVYERP